jgi:DNA repair exonuclease SbcCD nuclease subunit
MKIVILGDQHFLMRSGSTHFCKYQIRVWENLVFPYMEKHGIDTIIQTGDLFDHRTQLSLKSYHKIKSEIFDKLRDKNIQFHTLVGNHDMQLRETLEYNTSEIMLREYSNIHVYSKQTELEFDGLKVDIVPWICTENMQDVREFMTRPNLGEICVGHFEIAGALMQRGIPGHGGLSTDTFDRYTTVYSGHYHTRSTLDRNRINYVGTLIEMNWGDSGDQRGFTVLDTETLETEYIPNNDTMFIKLRYNNGCYTNPKTITGKYVKLIVENKKNLVDFDNYLNSLKMADPYDLVVIDSKIDLTGGHIDESVEIQDTQSIINQYIDGMSMEIDKNSVKQYVQSLLQEATNR